MNTTKVECAWCQKEFSVEVREYNRTLRSGRDYFFCSRSCSAKYGNAVRKNRRVIDDIERDLAAMDMAGELLELKLMPG